MYGGALQAPAPPAPDARAACRVQVGVLAWEAPLEAFLGNGSYGLGRKPCGEVPAARQIKLRCPCSDEAACGQLQRDVLERARSRYMSEFIVPE
jgi:hypothetical protein